MNDSDLRRSKADYPALFEAIRPVGRPEAAERHLPTCPGPYDWCVYANQCAAEDCRRNTP